LKYVIIEYVWWTGSTAATMSNHSNTVKGIATASMKTSTSQNIKKEKNNWSATRTNLHTYSHYN